MDPRTVDDSHAEQPVVPRGTTVLHPPGALERIAEFFGVRTASVHTLTVSHDVPSLYTAVCNYAAQLGRAAQDSAVHLAISSCDPFTSDARSLRRADREAIEDVGGDAENANASTRRKLKFQLGFCDAVLLWPPPSRLMRKQGVEAHVIPTVSSKTITANGISPSAESAGNRPSKPSHEEWPQNRSHLLYVIHYSLGLRDGNDRNALLLASVDEGRLRGFAQGVLDWHADNRAPSSYALRRFKSYDWGGGWKFEGLNRARPAESIILQQGQLQAIMDDVADFVSPDTRKWYVDHGLPHRRSFLFCGPPGTGKTSTVCAIASKFGLSCCFLSMTNSKFSNQLLGDAFADMPSDALLVIEDIDAMFNGRENAMSDSLSFSGLLNAFDGVLSAEGVITIMTTNHPEKLDAALTRGGRIDRRFYFGKPRADEICALFKAFYPDCDDDIARRFAEAVEDRPADERAMSIATLQEVFVRLRKLSAEDVVKNVPSFFEERQRLASARSDYDDLAHGKLYM